MITLRNNFHGTEHNIKAKIGDRLSGSQIRRARKALCPSRSSGCTCGGNLGERGPQPVVVDVDGYDRDNALVIRLLEHPNY